MKSACQGSFLCLTGKQLALYENSLAFSALSATRFFVSLYVLASDSWLLSGVLLLVFITYLFAGCCEVRPLPLTTRAAHRMIRRLDHQGISISSSSFPEAEAFFRDTRS